jgi:hypothetical protein
MSTAARHDGTGSDRAETCALRFEGSPPDQQIDRARQDFVAAAADDLEWEIFRVRMRTKNRTLSQGPTALRSRVTIRPV